MSLLPPFSLRHSALLISLAIAGVSHAQDKQLSTVVVSASGFEQELQEAPASISVVTREQLETRAYRDLAEALQDVEGLDVRGGTGKTGGLSINIRGMPSDYTLILIDGRRQNVAGDVTPNGFSDALTSFIPPLSAIERIEVIRGPMSTLYGSDAMGGVINIITRKVAKQWSGSLGLETSIPEDNDWGATHKLNAYVNGPLVEDLLGIAVRGNITRRESTERIRPATGNARDPAPAKSRQHNIGTKLTLTPTAGHEFWLDLDQASTWYDNEDCRLGGRDFLANNCATANTTVTGYKDYMRLEREQIAIGHSSKLSFGLLESSVMRSKTTTTGRTIPTASRPSGDPQIGANRKLETINTVVDSKLVAPLGDVHVGTLGAQWWKAELTDGLLPNDHEQTMWSIFAEDEWRLSDSLAATFGGRYDHHDAFGSELSPRAYLVWNAADHWVVKGGVSRGFKAPRLNQLIDGVSGISGQGTTISIGNPNLKPEISTSTELGVHFDNATNLSASATLFHNKVKDKISTGGDCTVNFISSCIANPSATYSVNTDQAKTWGLELSSRIVLAPAWQLNLNYTWTDSEIRQNGRTNGKLSDTAKHVANAQLRWATTEKLSLWVRGEYRGKSQRFDGESKNFTGNTLLEYRSLGDLKGYSLFHLGGAYKLNRQITLNANVFNLLDKDFTRFSSWTDTAGVEQLGSHYFRSAQSTKGTVTAGRTLWLSANIEF